MSRYKYFNDYSRNEIFEVKLNSLKELTTQRFYSQEHALNLANKTMEMRLDKLNELRNEVLEDRARYVPNDRCDMKHGLYEARIKQLEMWQSRMYGIAIGSTIIAGIIGGIIGGITDLLR